MKQPFIVYLKNKTSQKFEYKSDVSSVVCTGNGYSITFNNGRSYNYGTDKVQYYPFVSTRQNVYIYENGRLNKTFNTVDDYGRYLILRNGDQCSRPIENNAEIEICDIKKDTKQAESVIDYFKEILSRSGGVSFDFHSEEEENKNPNQVSLQILLKALDDINVSDPKSALSKYVSGVNPPVSEPKETLIYPFGCNESQKLADAEIEYRHIQVEQPLSNETKAALDQKFNRRWNFNKALKLKNLLPVIDAKNKLSLIGKIRFILQYGFRALNHVDKYREELDVYANHKFYELYINKVENEISDAENWLTAHNEEANLKRFIETSKEIFNGVLFKKYSRLDKASFNVDDYRNRFKEFTKHYPVILSSTLSLHTSISKHYLFDYLIIDESSQVDIIKSAVCFSCCRNVVVVGDSMQLTHIVDKQSKEVAEQLRAEYNMASAYDYVEQNILNSLKILYGDKIQSVLLKEHYRCHPTIIGFCNKKYYNNNLVVMTNGDNHPFRIIETNIAGGRENYNQRQIDETDLFIRTNYFADCTQVGVIAPYRKHADMLQEQLPDGTEADTIHKFQGREKDVIIFNTVKNRIGAFIDNPNLINVAVSRAVKEFIVVKPASMEFPHGTNIGDLIRYMCYKIKT